MIQHVYSLLCTHSIIDQDTQNLSLINVIEQINVPQNLKVGETLPTAFELVTLWVRTDPGQPAEASSRISMILPDGKKVVACTNPVDLSGHERIRNRVRFPGFKFRGEGRYILRVDLKQGDEGRWKEVTSIPLKVVYLAEHTND